MMLKKEMRERDRKMRALEELKYSRKDDNNNNEK